jgi:hypothetical protein
VKIVATIGVATGTIETDTSAVVTAPATGMVIADIETIARVIVDIAMDTIIRDQCSSCTFDKSF